MTLRPTPLQLRGTWSKTALIMIRIWGLTVAIAICILKEGLISSFLKGHAVLLALAVSAVWLVAGHGCFRKGNSVGAFLWGGIAVLILFAFSVHELLSWHGSWANLLLPIAGIGGESKLIATWMRQGGR